MALRPSKFQSAPVVTNPEDWDPRRAHLGVPVALPDPESPYPQTGVPYRTPMPSVTASVFLYKADTNDQAVTDPGAGKMRWNAIPQTASTRLVFDWLTSDGFDAHLLIKILGPATRLQIQDAKLATIYQVWEIVSVQESTDWFSAAVRFMSQAGPGGIAEFKNNLIVAVIVVANE